MAGKMADAVIEGLQMRAVDEAIAQQLNPKRMSRKKWPRKSSRSLPMSKTRLSEDEFLGHPSWLGWRAQRGRRDCRSE